MVSPVEVRRRRTPQFSPYIALSKIAATGSRLLLRGRSLERRSQVLVGSNRSRKKILPLPFSR